MTAITVKMEEAGLAASVENETAKKSLELLKAAELQTNDHLQWAVSATAEIKDKLAAVEEKRKSFTAPLKKVIADLDAFFKPAEASLKECEVVAKKKIVGFAEKRNATRRELIEQAGEAEDTHAAAELIIRAEAHEVPKVDGMSLRRAITFQILDPGDAIAWCVQNGRLDLLALDEKVCKTLAKADKLPEMDGVRWAETYSVAVTAGKVKR